MVKKSKVVYKEIGVDLYQKSQDGPMTVDIAKELLGWEEESEGTKFGSEFLLRDENGVKIRCHHNLTNRPFRMGLAKKYANEMLRGKWEMNCEPIILDRLGMIQSGQHRLIALVLAEQTREKDKEGWKEYWKSPVTIDILVAYGISEKPECVDTLDIGQKRSLGDVLYRNHQFPNHTERESKQLSAALSQAIKWLWIRTHAAKMSDAPHLPHSEALDFLKQHPGLQDSLEFVFAEEGGTGADGKKISGFLSLGYAAVLHYLMSRVKTELSQYMEDGSVDESTRDKADEFWTLFASGANLPAKSPILVLRKVLPSLSTRHGQFLIMPVIKSFNLWIDEKEATAAKVKVKMKKEEQENGDVKVIPAEDPRLGGLDVHLETLNEALGITDDEEEASTEETTETPEPTQDKPVKGKKSKGGWKAGDSGWVVDDDGDHWFGSVKEVMKDEEDQTVLVMTDEEGEEWSIPQGLVRVSKPIPKKPKAA